jgi:DNA-binding response OmpR family regulator
MARLLLIDDDVELTQLLRDYLGTEGYAVDAIHSGADAVSIALEGRYDLLLLDVGLPGANGFEVLRRLRERSVMPVLMLTARGDDVDRIVGLELGADDYLPKPCNPRELAARIRAILRRVAPSAPIGGRPDELRVDEVTLHYGTRGVTRAGEPVELTSTEFSVLERLLREAGGVVSKESLSLDALGRKLQRYDRSLDMHVSNLRRKLGEASIQTVRGVGYLYVRRGDATRTVAP